MKTAGKQRSKWRIVLWSVLAVLLLAAITAVIILYIIPYRDARSHMPEDGTLVIQEKKNGHLELSWPEAGKTDYYLVEVLHQVTVEGEEEPQWTALFATNVTEHASCPLPELPADELLMIRVNTMVGYEIPGEVKIRPGVFALETQLYLQTPVVENLQWTADPEKDAVKLSFNMTEGDKIRLFRLNEQDEQELVRTLTAGETVISFGEEADFPMPEHGESYRFRLDAYRELEGSVYYSKSSEEITVIREDLLDRELNLALEDQGDNVCSLSWSETKGQEYQVQVLQEGEWITIHTEPQAGAFSYTTDHLKAFREYTFRVVAAGGQTIEGETFAAVSKPVNFQTHEAVLFSTIWPLIKLDVFAAPDMQESIGKVDAGTTLCVADVQDGSFGIRFADGVIGYVDSDYCMIDLAEYLGELCAYNITNSYSSKYKANKYKIPKVTGTVITGYEDVLMEDGTYLVPLLYPVAQRLMGAAQAAQEAGYRLKIYDAYRPNQATVSLYSRAEDLQDKPVPGNIPDPDAPEDAEGDAALLTYAKVMTNNGQYPLNYFLAKGYSKHNLGVALDLTIEDLESGEEKGMQTAMHDLSHYSVIYRNNKNAKALDSIMKEAGFAGLVSEWWHFQDNEARTTLKLKPLWGGVSPEGWKLSDHGWRYRLEDGTYAADCTLTIGETEYSFDANGCLIEN